MKLYRLFILLVLFIGFVSSCSNDGIEDTTIETNIAFGMVVNERTNEPIQGASVTIYPSGRTVITGTTGQYEFRGLQPGNYLLQVSKNDYLSNTKSITIDDNLNTTQADIALSVGKQNLDVLIGELYFGKKSNTKIFVVSNIGNETINWNVYTDYDLILSFDINSGILEPGQSQAVSVSLNRMLTNADLTSFPIFIYANGEELGVIATIDRNSAGINNSLLVGEWKLVYMQYLDNGEIWYNSYNSANNILNICSDYTYEYYNHNIIAHDLEDLDAMLNYSYQKSEYDYDMANSILVLDPDMGYRNSVYRINTLNERTLEIETVQTIGTEEWRLFVYERR